MDFHLCLYFVHSLNSLTVGSIKCYYRIYLPLPILKLRACQLLPYLNFHSIQLYPHLTNIILKILPKFPFEPFPCLRKN